MRTITARPFWRKPASSMSASASACSSWSTACRRKPTPRPGRRVRRSRSATMVMLALGVSTLVGSILFVWLYVGRNILRRISNLQRSMQLLSSGDLESEIYQSHQQDEIGAMAEFAAGVPREHDPEPRALRRAGQGPHRQERTRLPHGSADRRVRSHRSHRARQPADRGGLDAVDRAKHVGDRRSIQRAGERGGVRRRGDLGQRADRVVGHRGTVVLDRGNRPPGRHLGGDRPQGGRRRRRDRRHHAGACRQRRAASASWST